MITPLPKPSKKAKKANHYRRNKRRALNSMIRALDAACRARVFQRDGDTCVRCGSTENPQWSHIITREYRSIRWDDDNSVVHCRDCHCWYTYHHALGYDWFAKKYPERWERIVRVLQTGNGRKLSEADIKALWDELNGKAVIQNPVHREE